MRARGFEAVSSELSADMYEHSDHIDCGAKAAIYADTFMNAIR
jgi:hypothetical protein